MSGKDGAQLAAGTLVGGRYRIEGLLGQGGMGAVYQAEDTRFDAPVAVKVTAAAGHAHDQTRERFVREARLGNLMGREPGIVRVLDYGEMDAGRLYLVMDLVVGGRPLDLEQGTREQRLDRLEEATALVARVHAAGVVHRDLKPDNFMRDEAGRLWLADFGLAKQTGDVEDAAVGGLTMTGIGFGTPYFMPPEQFEEARDAGPRADVYALGTMLFVALSKILPFRGKGPTQILRDQIQIQMGRLRMPRPRDFDASLPGELEAVCLRAMSMEPERRYACAGELLAAIREARQRRLPKSERVPAAAGAALRGGSGRVASGAAHTLPRDTGGRDGGGRDGGAPDPRPREPAPRPREGAPSADELVRRRGLSAARESMPTMDSFEAARPPRRRSGGGVAVGALVVAAALGGGALHAHRQGWIHLFGPTRDELYAQGRALYDQGRYEEAAPKILRAAERGHVEAMVELGDMYEAGAGVARRPLEAINWYDRAAKLGSKKAELRLSTRRRR